MARNVAICLWASIAVPATGSGAATLVRNECGFLGNPAPKPKAISLRNNVVRSARSPERMIAVVVRPDGSGLVRAEAAASAPGDVAHAVARSLLEQGAGDILLDAGR